MKALRRILPRWLQFGLLGGALAADPLPAGSTNELRAWPDYRTILWIGDSAGKRPEKLPLFYERLRQMGVNTSMVTGDASPQTVLDNRFSYYVENIVNRGLCLKWNSSVRDWDRFVTTWAKNGRPESAFVRDYCFDDPQWLSQAKAQVRSAARQHAAHEPLAYDLRDELSVTHSANPFDYDFNPLALAGFRAWLQEQYSTLAALNAEWETGFATWEEVKPFSTDQIKARQASGEPAPRGKPDWQALQGIKFDPARARQESTRWNFAPWCDFRTYLDVSLARTLAALRGSAREIDPRTPVGIEGTQMPSAFGGYDLWRLAQVLDWVEPYDIGNAREIFGAFMPGRPILTTVFEKDTNSARRRLWHLLLEGDRGCIIWWSEDCIDWQSPDYALTPKAKALAPVLREMTSPLALLFLRAKREFDPIAILYSQPSLQVDWLLESTPDGSTWPRRFSSFEAEHNRQARVRNSWLKLFQDLGFTPRFVSAEELTAHALPSGGFRVLVLPEALALSAAEGEHLRAFLYGKPGARDERFLFSDGTPGLFDEHGRLKTRSRLEDLFPAATSAERSYVCARGRKTISRAGDLAEYAAARAAVKPDLAWARWAGDAIQPMAPEVRVPPEARARVHRFSVAGARLIAIERGIDYHMSEALKQAGGNEHLEVPIEVEARLARPAHIYDLRRREYLGHVDRIRCKLDPWEPSLFALLDEPVRADAVIETLLARAAAK